VNCKIKWWLFVINSILYKTNLQCRNINMYLGYFITRSYHLMFKLLAAKIFSKEDQRGIGMDRLFLLNKLFKLVTGLCCPPLVNTSGRYKINPIHNTKRHSLASNFFFPEWSPSCQLAFFLPRAEDKILPYWKWLPSQMIMTWSGTKFHPWIIDFKS
jgi:hypothetical protein